MDVYDTLLTQAEIQGNINQVNDVIRKKKAEEACKFVRLSGTNKIFLWNWCGSINLDCQVHLVLVHIQQVIFLSAYLNTETTFFNLHVYLSSSV